jgi:hypothetical protein
MSVAADNVTVEPVTAFDAGRHVTRHGDHHVTHHGVTLAAGCWGARSRFMRWEAFPAKREAVS